MMRRYWPHGRSAGFTLVELLIVIILIAVLAAIALPRFVNSGLRAKESALRSDLKLVRDAIDRFQSDTGAFPANLDSLTALIAPARGLDPTGASILISAADWRGPYLASIPADPVSTQGLTYSLSAGSGNSVGQLTSSAPGTDSSGIPFRYY